MKPYDICDVDRIESIKLTLADGRARVEVCLFLFNGTAHRIQFNDAHDFDIWLNCEGKLNIFEVFLNETEDGYFLFDEGSDSISFHGGPDLILEPLPVDDRGRIVGRPMRRTP